MALLSQVRYRDAIIFAAPAIVGLVLFVPDLSLTSAARMVVVGLGSFLLMAYIFAFNDWADINLDFQNANRRGETFLDKGIARGEIFGLTCFLATAGITILALVSWTHFVIGIVVVLLGIAYSYPLRGVRGKGIPVVSSLLHLATTMLAFLLGSMAFAPIDLKAVMIGSYFAVIIAAGHLVQEVQDYDADRDSDVRTNAVQFGKRPVFVAAFMLFGISFLLLITIAQSGAVPGVMKYGVLLYPIYAVWAQKAYKTGLRPESVQSLRKHYRILFAAVILVLLASALMQKVALPAGV